VKRRAVLAVCVTAGAAVGIALAGPPGTRPVPHEPLPELAGDHAQPTIGGSGSGNPAAIAAGDKLLPKPPLDRHLGSADAAGSGSPHEPVLGAGGFAADRDTQMKPDEQTGADDTLHYQSVFNPDVLPFKRMSTFDRVGDDQTLHVAQTALVELPVGGTTDPRTRDRFWGDVLVQLTPGRDVALPSVAPDMRILSYEVKPKLALRFSKDGADNFYVRSDEASAHGTYRLVFLADADAGYFAPSLPRTKYLVRDVAAHAPPELRIPVPATLAADTRLTFQQLGLDRDMDLGIAFNALVGYFRGFQAGDIRNNTGDTYRDLCDSKVGVCRHRSFAFMITANALGIPTRLVENEAHAFVEVWFPERGWQRIDLGGSALHMDVEGASDKTLHRPRAEDPFTKPPEYKQSYTQLEGDIHGLTQQQIADKRKGLDQSPPSGAVGDGSGGSSSGSAGPDYTDRISPDQTLPAVTQDPKKPTPSLVVTLADATAYRGGSLHVQGSVRATGKPLADHGVSVWIRPSGRRDESILLGTATTGANGIFDADLAIPPHISLETYDVILSSNDDAQYNAALSE
jgi:transglutaminase-like putative cysteine protease